jgi:hypothetical protein
MGGGGGGGGGGGAPDFAIFIHKHAGCLCTKVAKFDTVFGGVLYIVTRRTSFSAGWCMTSVFFNLNSKISIICTRKPPHPLIPNFTSTLWAFASTSFSPNILDVNGYGHKSKVLLLIHGFPTSSYDWNKVYTNAAMFLSPDQTRIDCWCMRFKVCEFTPTRYNISHVFARYYGFNKWLQSPVELHSQPNVSTLQLCLHRGLSEVTTWLLMYPWDDVICQTRWIYSCGNKHRHPYSEHHYSYLYATVLGNVFGHGDC